MATRDVQLRLTSTGLDKLVAQFSDLSKKLDTIIARLDDISRKLDVLGNKKATPTVAVDGIEKALAQVALLKAALDDLGSTRATAAARGGGANALSDFMYNSLYRPDTGGSPFTGGMSGEIQRMLARDRAYGGLGTGGGFESLFRSPGAFTTGHQGILRGMLGRESALAGGGIDRGVFNMLGSFGRWGGIPGGIGRGLMSAGGAVGGAASSAGTTLGKVPWAGIGIGGGIGLLASMTPALIPTLLGLGVGGAGVFGAMKVASNANTNLQALQSTLQSAQQTYQQDIATGASSQQTAYDRAQMTQAQQAVNVFQKQNAPALRLYGAGQGLAGAASSSFMSAITSTDTRTVQDRVGHGLGTGTHQVAVGGTSFMAGLTKTLGGLQSFMSSPAMQKGLGELFRASLPFINMFVKSLEDFARIVGPAVVNMLKQFRPELPMMRQGFKYLSEGIADFLKYLGPGMRDAAVIFKGVMMTVKGLLIAAAFVIDATARAIHVLGSVFSEAAHVVGDAAKDIWRWVKSTFDQIVKGAKDIIPTITTIGVNIIMGLVHGIESMAGRVASAVKHIIGGIPGAIMHFFNMGSPSKLMMQIGGHVGEGLALGIDSKQGRVMSSAMNLTRGIPGAVGAGGLGRGGAPLPITIQLQLSNDLMQVISRQIRVSGGDPRILIRKVRIV